MSKGRGLMKAKLHLRKPAWRVHYADNVIRAKTPLSLDIERR